MQRMTTFLATFLFSTIAFANTIDNKYIMTMRSEPTARLTNNWAFVIDTSHSMGLDRIKKAHKGYLVATKFPTDDLKFCVFTFNDRGVDRFRKWRPASPDQFKKAFKWVSHKWQQGVLSYGAVAIKKALHLKRGKLTIILITDGGFTEPFETIKATIEEGQKWRSKNGYSKAIISVIGVENLYYRAGCKKPDHICQEFLQKIGIRNHGGYFYVKRNKNNPKLIK